MQSEKFHFEETVGAMSEQLMDFVEKMNKLEKECVSHISKNNPEWILKILCGDGSLQKLEFFLFISANCLFQIKYKRDCALVVQLLKCNQSLDRKFVSQKVETVSLHVVVYSCHCNSQLKASAITFTGECFQNYSQLCLRQTCTMFNYFS